MASLKVIYGIDARFGGGGIGYIAYNAVKGIYEAHWLTRLFVSSNAQSVVPASLIRQWGIMGRGIKYLAAKDSSGLVNYVGNLLFDTWVSARLPQGDIFHGWNGHSLWTLRKAKQRGMVTVIERASSHPATAARLLRQEYERWNVPLRRLPMWNYTRSLCELAETDYITIPSAFVHESMVAEGTPPGKLIEIPFGMDAAHFLPRPSVSPHPFRIIFAGQVSIRKGVPYLLEAWQRLHWPEAELWIVGGITPDFASLRPRWTHLAGVKFWGHSSELPRLFQQSDLFVFPSIEEGSALVTYEAMACGLPVITTFHAGSVVRDGQDGFIVPIRDVTALCEWMQYLRDNATLRVQMGQSARERVSQFTWPVYQSRLVKAYRHIAKDVILE